MKPVWSEHTHTLWVWCEENIIINEGVPILSDYEGTTFFYISLVGTRAVHAKGAELIQCTGFFSLEVFVIGHIKNALKPNKIKALGRLL